MMASYTFGSGHGKIVEIGMGCFGEVYGIAKFFRAPQWVPNVPSGSTELIKMVAMAAESRDSCGEE